MAETFKLMNVTSTLKINNKKSCAQSKKTVEHGHMVTHLIYDRK